MKNIRNPVAECRNYLKKLSLLSLCLLLVGPSWSQSGKKPKDNTSTFLEGKIFTIAIFTFDGDNKTPASAATDEITFVNGKLQSQKIGKEFNLTADTYTAHTDSTKGPNAVTFVAFSRNASGAVEIFWKGTVTGDGIKGTMHWFSEGKTKMFAGTIKRTYTD